MRIALVSDLECDGGAAVAASRLAAGLTAAGCEVVRVVGKASAGEHPWRTLELTGPGRRPLAERAVRRVARRATPQVVRRWDRAASADRLERQLAELRPDAVNLHNIHFAGLPAEVAAECLRVAPTVWTLHDMWSFTGRCAYRFDCQKHLTGCDATCPTADEYPRVQPHLIRDEWERRRDLFRSTPGLVAVTPSRWLADEARAGLWAGHRVEVIPNGLPLEVFHPVERGLARAALGLPSDRPVLVVAAQHLGDRRKGGHLLSAALPLVAHRPLTVLTLGEGRPPATGTGIETVGLGYVTSDRLKALAYSAADVFVHPAPADNLPNVLLEALACGTPAVGFAVGGMPDVIRPGVSGWLAPEPTAAALARAITEALGELAAGADYRPRCRDLAEREYAQHTQAERYLALFRSLTRAA